MEVKVVDKENHEKEIEVKVPYERLAGRLESAYKKYKKSVQIEGFRKGKVPIQILKKIYGKAIEAEVIDDALPEILQEAIDQEKVKFYDLVKVTDVDFKEGTGLSFKALIKVEPEIELTKYKGFEFEKEVYQVGDEDVDAAIKNLQERSATMVNVEDEAKDGHFLIADLQKTDEAGHPLIGEKYENQYLRLDLKNEEDEVSQQLKGVKAGETRRIHVQIQGEDETPKTEYFLVTVKEIKEKQLPEIDDEFAKDLGEGTLDALKKRIKDDIKSSAADEDEEKFETHVIDKLVKENPIELPEFMVEGYLDRLIESLRKNSKEQIDEENLRNELRADAIRNLKWLMIRDKIAELENLKVEDSELDAYIEDKLKSAGREAPKLKRELRNPENRNRLRTELLQKKVIDLIVANSTVKEKIITREDLKKQEELAQQLQEQ